MKTTDNHLSKKTLKAVANGDVDTALALAAADHIAVCDECAERLANLIEQSATTPPRGFAELTALKISGDMDKKRKEFYIYCVKVAACAAAVIALTFSNIIPRALAAIPERQFDSIPEPQHTELPEPGKSPSLLDKIDDYLDSLKNSTTHSEENPNDQTEKQIP